LPNTIDRDSGAGVPCSEGAAVGNLAIITASTGPNHTTYCGENTLLETIRSSTIVRRNALVLRGDQPS